MESANNSASKIENPARTIHLPAANDMGAGSPQQASKRRYNKREKDIAISSKRPSSEFIRFEIAALIRLNIADRDLAEALILLVDRKLLLIG